MKIRIRNFVQTARLEVLVDIIRVLVDNIRVTLLDHYQC